MGSREVQTAGLSEDFLLDQPVAGDWKRSIREGEDYQAEIPEFIGGPCVQESSSDNEQTTLLWTSASMENLTKTQVDSYLEQVCGVGEKVKDASKEHAMHVLHQTGGDIQKAVSILTSDTGLDLPQGHPMLDYTFSGCEAWSDEENDRFLKSLRLHGKKFPDVARHVQTKTVKQCIQYYYVFKKLFPKKYNLVRPGKNTLVMQPIVTDKHNTRGSSRRAVAAAARRANETAQIRDTDVSVALNDSLPSHSLSTDRVEEEMECVDSNGGSVFAQGARTNQQIVPNVAAPNCSTPKEQSSPSLPHSLFPCTFEDCHKCYSSNRSLQSHMSWHKKVTKSSPSTPSQRKVKVHSSTLTLSSMSTPAGDHSSTLTSSSMSTPAGDHSYTSVGDHSGETVFPCTKCDRVFARIKSRNAHMRCHKTTLSA